jgi:FHA domain
LEIMDGSGSWFIELEGRRVDLRGGEYTLGRSRGCGVVLRDPSVSRGHALLSVRDGAVTLQDLQSSNGTYVNGRRLDAEVRLAPGDRVILGETELFLRRQAGSLESREGVAPGGGPPTAEHALFCPACGTPLPAGAAGCEACGRPLGAERTPRRSEALALGEVLPVGEVLGAPSGSWDETRFRQGMQGMTERRPTGSAAAVSEPHPTRATAEMRVPLPELPAPDAGRASLRRRMAGAWRVLLGRDDESEP